VCQGSLAAGTRERLLEVFRDWRGAAL
jgi:hypothetical protein